MCSHLKTVGQNSMRHRHMHRHQLNSEHTMCVCARKRYSCGYGGGLLMSMATCFYNIFFIALRAHFTVISFSVVILSLSDCVCVCLPFHSFCSFQFNLIFSVAIFSSFLVFLSHRLPLLVFLVSHVYLFNYRFDNKCV